RRVKQLLVVEDYEVQRKAIVALIGNGDVITTAVDSGEAALEALARRSAVPLEADIRLSEPLPSPIERSAYFVAAELTSNAIKHAAARRIVLTVITEPAATTGGPAVLRIRVTDDGIGGAGPVAQHGLAGAAERLAGLGGELRIVSPAGGPTEVTATIPLPHR
ncbi:MAG TPA: ATP-binding protein, partial [Amnibacterium sp.]|nr:ATP-binding protein [Amnibacterium sp.]